MTQPTASGRVKLAALRSASLMVEPFRWAWLEGALTASAAHELAASFPNEGFAFSERRNGEKPYRVWRRQLASDGIDRALPPIWQEFAASLFDDRYRAEVSRLAGLDLNGAPLELTFWRYPPECWLAPHLDKPEKLVTQIFYFNPVWNPSWGGTLRILRSRNLGDVAAELVPRLNCSALLVRSHDSWHAVAPVEPDSRADARRSVTAIFYQTAESDA